MRTITATLNDIMTSPILQAHPVGELVGALKTWTDNVDADLISYKRGADSWYSLFGPTAAIDMRAEYDTESHVMRVDWITSDCTAHVWDADTLEIDYTPGIFDGDDEPLAELAEQWQDVRRALEAGDTAPGLTSAVEANGRLYLALSDDEPMSVDAAVTAMGW